MLNGGPPSVINGLHRLVEAIVNNRLSAAATALLREQRGIALPKPQRDTRPIAIAETFFCLAAGALQHKYANRINEPIGTLATLSATCSLATKTMSLWQLTSATPSTR